MVTIMGGKSLLVGFVSVPSITNAKEEKAMLEQFKAPHMFFCSLVTAPFPPKSDTPAQEGDA